MKQIEVQIMGQGYRLGCPEGGEARLQEAATRVDAAMCKIRDAGKIKARDKIAVLTALNLAFDTQELTSSAANAVDTPNTSATPSQPTPQQSQQLGALIARLDAALGGDGRLI